MLQKLQEENYALKGAQFTFEFPVNDSVHHTHAFNNSNPTATPVTDMSHKPAAVDKNSMYHTTTSGSSMSSNNSYSGEDGNSSAEQSPLSNSHTHEDDSTSADTPISSIFTTEPLQFGLIGQQQPPLLPHQQLVNNDSLDFLGTSNNAGFNAQQIIDFPTGDLFHGKDDLFASYRVPTTNNANDDFLFANEDLTSLFGTSDDLFNFGNNINNQLNLNAQFGLPETPASRRLTAETRELLVNRVKQGQQEGKYIQQMQRDLQQECPDFNLDVLCDDLRNKATCSLTNHPLTDQDVNSFLKCLSRV